MLKEELDALKEQFPERFQVTHVLSREPQEDALFEGRITTEKLGQLLDKNSEIKPEDSTFFICGPTEMIKSTSDFLKKEEKFLHCRFYMNISLLQMMKIMEK